MNYRSCKVLWNVAALNILSTPFLYSQFSSLSLSSLFPFLVHNNAENRLTFFNYRSWFCRTWLRRTFSQRRFVYIYTHIYIFTILQFLFISPPPRPPHLPILHIWASCVLSRSRIDPDCPFPDSPTNNGFWSLVSSVYIDIHKFCETVCHSHAKKQSSQHCHDYLLCPLFGSCVGYL